MTLNWEKRKHNTRQRYILLKLLNNPNNPKYLAFQPSVNNAMSEDVPVCLTDRILLDVVVTLHRSNREIGRRTSPGLTEPNAHTDIGAYAVR